MDRGDLQPRASLTVDSPRTWGLDSRPVPHQVGARGVMSHPSKLVDRAKSGYQIRQHESGVYQVFAGKPTATNSPAYTSYDLTRARAWRDSRAAGAARPSGATIPSTVRVSRGYVRVNLSPVAVAAIDSVALPGESRQDAARRLVIRGAEMSGKTDGS